MKTEGQVRQKLKQVTYRHLKKRLVANFKKSSCTCVHNALVDLDGEEVGVCIYNISNIPRGVLCDARFDNDQMASECPIWEPMQTKEQVKEDFNKFLEESSLGEIASMFPDVAALMWVLDDTDVVSPDIDESSSKDVPDENTVSHRGWWRLLWRR